MFCSVACSHGRPGRFCLLSLSFPLDQCAGCDRSSRGGGKGASWPGRAHEVPERPGLELARCHLCSIPVAKAHHMVKSKVKGRRLRFILDASASPHGGADGVGSTIPSVTRSFLPSQVLLLLGEPLTETARE